MDHFEHAVDSLIAPAKDLFPIVPSDSIDLLVTTKAIYVGTGGDLVLRAVDSGADVRIAGVGSGAILPFRVKAVRLTGTTAADIVGLA
jgi:hypothetical protein